MKNGHPLFAWRHVTDMRTPERTEQKVDYSIHARERMEQRSIPRSVVELLLDYCELFEAGSGSYIGCLHGEASKREFARAAKERGLRSAERYFAVYVVYDVTKEVIITVGHRYKRIKKSLSRKRKACLAKHNCRSDEWSTESSNFVGETG